MDASSGDPSKSQTSDVCLAPNEPNLSGRPLALGAIQSSGQSLPTRSRDVFVGRQPIYDRDLCLDAYELLFRRGDVATADVIDGDEASFRVMLNALVEIGLSRLVGPHRAFVNVTRNSVLCAYPQFFPKEQVVLEVLETVKVDEELVEMVRDFADQGYTIALDDFEERDELKPLLEVASIIKMDVQALGPARTKRQADRFRRFRILAEKVETREQFEACRDLGFDYFQGYFLSKPRVITVKHVPTSQLSTLRLLTKLYDPEVTTAEVAEMISQDVSLTYRLLRTVQPEKGGASQEIDSVEAAVSALGLPRVCQWVTLLSISGVDDCPLDVLYQGMVRAKACEVLSGLSGYPCHSRFYLVGLFSVLEDFMGGSLENLLEGLPLSDEIGLALHRRDGLAGQILTAILEFESGKDVVSLPTGVSKGDVQRAMKTASEFADGVRSSIGF